MTTDVREYVAAGYYLSKWEGLRDCTGIQLRRLTLAGDHSQRRFFPNARFLSWTGTTDDDRIEEAKAWGIPESRLHEAVAWMDRVFDSEVGAWSVLFTLSAARQAARMFLSNAESLELLGVGLHRSLADKYCQETAPSSPAPGTAPMGASGTHLAVCRHRAVLESGGTVLGHEILIDDLGSCFNSPQSRHLDESSMFKAVGLTPNADGLIDSFDDALSCCRYLDAHAHETQHRIVGWRPWLITRYSLD